MSVAAIQHGVIGMNNKALSCLIAVALGTTLALAPPAFARGGGGGGFGGGHGGGGGGGGHGGGGGGRRESFTLQRNVKKRLPRGGRASNTHTAPSQRRAGRVGLLRLVKKRRLISQNYISPAISPDSARALLWQEIRGLSWACAVDDE